MDGGATSPSPASLVTAMSLLRADRRALGWVGGALLGAGELGAARGTSACTQPEAYTLPSAVALLVVGGCCTCAADPAPAR